jgi:threonine dehydrogenase-like Zn-dependent dehydrogenase
MPAAVLQGPKALAVEERPVPELAAHDALVEVSHCGICGTDLHMVLDGWGEPGSIGGHEYSGVIAALGDGIAGWAVGDRVVSGPRAACGTCEYCRDNRPSLCRDRTPPGIGGFQGAFAGYARVHESELRRIPDNVDLRTAALTEPLAVALHALTNGRVRPGQRALVTGAGPIGLLVVAALRAAGVDEIVVSEPTPRRRDRALAVGASRAVMPDELTVPTFPTEVGSVPSDLAFECSGHAEAMEAALAQLVAGGTLVLVGSGMRKPRFDPNRILLNELVVTGSYNYDGDGFERALELLASGRLPTELLIEPGDVPLGGMVTAMEQLAVGELPGKVLRGSTTSP